MGTINTEIGGIILCLLLFFALPSFLIVSFLIKRNDVLTDLNIELKKQNQLISERNKQVNLSNQSLKSLLHDQNEIINKSIIKNFSKSCSN